MRDTYCTPLESFQEIRNLFLERVELLLVTFEVICNGFATLGGCDEGRVIREGQLRPKKSTKLKYDL